MNFNPMQIISMIQNAGNPMAMMQQMFGGNPLMQRAMNMGRGKSENDLKQTVRNLAKQKGMSQEQLSSFVSQFGLQL